MKRYFIGVGIVILLLLLLVVFVFRRDNKPANPAQNTGTVAQLVDYADKNSEVSLTTIGKVVGNEQHRSVRITVSANERRIEILSGYDQQVLSSQTYANNQEAYETFLSALGGQGFTRSKKTSITDPRSVCPTGLHYQYLVTENSEEKSNLWSVSCDKSGSFSGRSGTIRELFQRQIPDYNQQVRGITL
jgi:hypothetical protein